MCLLDGSGKRWSLPGFATLEGLCSIPNPCGEGFYFQWRWSTVPPARDVNLLMDVDDSVDADTGIIPTRVHTVSTADNGFPGAMSGLDQPSTHIGREKGSVDSEQRGNDRMERVPVPHSTYNGPTSGGHTETIGSDMSTLCVTKQRLESNMSFPMAWQLQSR